MHGIGTAVSAAIIAVAMVGSAHAEKVYYIRNADGGKIATHIARYEEVARKFDRVEVVGMCKSACTMVLGIVPLNRICIRPGGFFAFHAAHGPGHVQSDVLTQEVYRHYAAPVKAWVNAHKALATQELTYLYAKDVKFIKPCTGPAKYQ